MWRYVTGWVVPDVSKDRGAVIFKGQGVQDGRLWLAQNVIAELPLRIGMRVRWLRQMHKSQPPGGPGHSILYGVVWYLWVLSVQRSAYHRSGA